jgi:hypothetical protein
LIMELYAEDMELFESTCMTKADPIWQVTHERRKAYFECKIVKK